MYVLDINTITKKKYQTSQNFSKKRQQILYDKLTSYKFKEKDQLAWIDINELTQENTEEKFRCVFYKSVKDNIPSILNNAYSFKINNHISYIKRT